MSTRKPTRRSCPNGHSYYKSSDCPVCPICEREKVPASAFLALLGAPARRALEHAGIISPEALSRYSEKELLALHGFGPGSLPALREVLEKEGMDFEKKEN